jgi:hypothetical protein
MVWFNERVICDLFQTQLCNENKQSMILSVSSDSPPGFTLLQLLSPTSDGQHE